MRGNAGFRLLRRYATAGSISIPFRGKDFRGGRGKRMLLGVPSAFEMGLNLQVAVPAWQQSVPECRRGHPGGYPQVNMDFRVLEEICSLGGYP